MLAFNFGESLGIGNVVTIYFFSRHRFLIQSPYQFVNKVSWLGDWILTQKYVPSLETDTFIFMCIINLASLFHDEI